MHRKVCKGFFFYFHDFYKLQSDRKRGRNMSKRILDHPILGKTEAHLKKLETLVSNSRSDRLY